MNKVASQRLIDAAAALAPADRALLNLLVTRGLDNDSLARLSRVNAAVIVARRERMVHTLSDELGLPPDHVRDALDELGVAALEPSAGTDPAPPANGNGASATASHPAIDAPHGTAEAPAEVAAIEAPHGTAEAADVAGGSEPRSARKRLVSVAVAVLGVAAVVVVLLVSGSTKHPRRAPVTRSNTAAATRSTPTPAAPTPITTRAQPTPPHLPVAAGAHPQRLVVLPGGTSQATGSVALAGNASHPRLTLDVSGLIAAQGGHFEAWLYNSILDSVPLVRLRSGVTSFSVPLPRDFRRYRWIDISFQPPGLVQDSGESVMRASLP